MWIVLLDHSGSMGDPFEADEEDLSAVERVRSVDAEIKWEAAKKSFLVELKRLPEDMEVLLFGFMEETHLIYSGRASQADEFERRLRDVSPDDGTDIATALDSVGKYANSHPQVLLITDGISDLEEAKAKARQCASQSIRVDVLVIDPTKQGREMAKAVAGITHGRWDLVSSAEQLEKLTRKSAESYNAILARASEIMHEADREFEEISKNTLDKTKVSFSAGYPSRIDADQKYPLVVYIHLEGLKDKIEEFLKKEIVSTGAIPSSSTAAASTRIPQGTLITVQPNISDVFSNPPQQEVVWMEDYHRVAFEIRYTGNKNGGTTCSGFVDVFANGVLVGNIPVSLAINTKTGSVADAEPTMSLGNSFTRIFASYAHEDAAIVQACKEAYKLLGIHLYVDRDDLLSGQPWRATLQKLIVTSDLFQLYWSKSSADSIEVEKEWKLALQVGEMRANNFIRPFYWQEPLPAPPQELGHIHFAYLDTRKLHIGTGMPVVEEELKIEENTELDAVFPVISMTSEDTDASTNILQKSMGQSVSFLEKLTGLRYYPPTTLLVDDYLIKTIRSQMVVDQNKGSLDQSNTDIEAVLDILQALALQFHVRGLEPEDNQKHDEEWQKKFYDIETDDDLGDFRHVRTMCEYIFAHPVKKYLQGEDPFKQTGRKSAEELKQAISEHVTKYQVSGLIEYHLRDDVGCFYSMAKEEDQKKIEQIIGAENLTALLDEEAELTDEQIRRIASACISGDYLSITQKYRNGFCDFFQGYKTTLCRSHTYPEYIEKWLDCWLRYMKSAADKNTAPISIGFHTEEISLVWLRSKYPDIRFQIQPRWIISANEMVRIVERLTPILMNALHDTGEARKIQQYFISTASTYGIFANAESEMVTQRLLQITREQNWPAGMALAGSHKVLLCSNAFERYKTELLELGADKQQIDEMATWFLIATLVHEHFHGIVATGIDKHGKGSWASRDWNEWQKGNLLNESLAAWVERHYFRGNQAMFENITQYIQSGDYPDWPYRGAEKIECIYKDQGLLGVRFLIHRLREDPQLAQETFDNISV